MTRRLKVCAAGVLALSAAGAAWQDPSPHKVQLVTVEDDVRLEVLDWGGTGRPCVLLAGYLTAHAFDDFAPKLAQMCHVYGITRGAMALRAGRKGVTRRSARPRTYCGCWMRCTSKSRYCWVTRSAGRT